MSEDRRGRGFGLLEPCILDKIRQIDEGTLHDFRFQNIPTLYIYKWISVHMPELLEALNGEIKSGDSDIAGLLDAGQIVRRQFFDQINFEQIADQIIKEEGNKNVRQ